MIAINKLKIIFEQACRTLLLYFDLLLLYKTITVLSYGSMIMIYY